MNWNPNKNCLINCLTFRSLSLSLSRIFSLSRTFLFHSFSLSSSFPLSSAGRPTVTLYLLTYNDDTYQRKTIKPGDQMISEAVGREREREKRKKLREREEREREVINPFSLFHPHTFCLWATIIIIMISTILWIQSSREKNQFLFFFLFCFFLILSLTASSLSSYHILSSSAENPIDILKRMESMREGIRIVRIEHKL